MKRVLVIDDEQSVRSLVALSLEGPDCKVDTFCDGRDALESLTAEQPDLILLDVGLPGMRGDEVLRRLRADQRTAAIPVLMLTGLEPPEGSEPDGVILKPFTPSSLRSCLEDWLS
jgi:two-component system, OmpR family, alkaline phosphatase synthesis response regulator PhoP